MGDGADGWTRRSATERSEGRGNGCLLEWADPGRKREEGEGREASGSAGEMGQQAESEEGRGREKNFLFFFQIKFPNSFPNDFRIFLSLNQNHSTY